ncbi:hypothetical protein AG1IA_06552 [Rhizoctonia solani AG-1 IA]|uniref:Uncharacterized protein n=1 Tax=Thanatephorus cucumeris (strain AG1-IA) TaxID=983506 RepID=L8WN73_THACA|nr:hypothetical protein AG1IA_06552 [Rhizoctonia solani AG-1 IA]
MMGLYYDHYCPISIHVILIPKPEAISHIAGISDASSTVGIYKLPDSPSGTGSTYSKPVLNHVADLRSHQRKDHPPCSGKPESLCMSGYIQLIIQTHTQVTSQEGQGDKVASLLKVIRDYSNSDKEPAEMISLSLKSEWIKLNELELLRAVLNDRYADGAAIRAYVNPYWSSCEFLLIVLRSHFETEGFKNLVNEMKTGTLAVGVS